MVILAVEPSLLGILGLPFPPQYIQGEKEKRKSAYSIYILFAGIK